MFVLDFMEVRASLHSAFHCVVSCPSLLGWCHANHVIFRLASEGGIENFFLFEEKMLTLFSLPLPVALALPSAET